MQIRPILSSLMRSKIALILIGLQIALTLAIVCNALFIVVQRLDRMARPSGLDEADTFEVVSLGFGTQFDVRGAVRQDLVALRAMPGVVDATPINRVPMGRGGWSTGISLSQDQKTPTLSTAVYMVDDHALAALGVPLLAGRNFEPGEVAFRDLHDPDWPPGVIITRAIAERLFPGQQAVGKLFYLDPRAPANTIIGVVERLQAPWLNTQETEYSTLMPQIRPYGLESRYLIRAQAGRRDEVMSRVEATLGEINAGRIVRGLESMQQVRFEGYKSDRMMAVILGLVIALLLAITALSIVGMASFWVAQRTRQIGTRRALGATRLNILHYFQMENFIITTLGLAGGGVLAYALNLWLMQAYQMPQLPWYYVPIGFTSLWILGQLAVLGPALRASRVPPAIATRSV
jgi:putative ABC transport system permease protein